jgi:hypothetical protein
MSREEIESWLRLTILQVQDGLSSDQVVASASLFQDLGFDSLTFEKLVGTIESAVLGKDLTPWYVRAASHGEDTLGSLIEFLIAGPVAEGEPT